jgi:hypothetical protein
MEIMKVKLTSLAMVVVLIGMTACNKTKKLSERFMDACEWRVVTLTVDGVAEAELPELHIEDCDIYESVCYGEWENEEGGHAEFAWQFRDKARTFEISYQVDEDHHGHFHSHAEEEAAAQCYAFSGVYEVVQSDKSRIEITTTNAVGHPGKTVILIMEKAD